MQIIFTMKARMTFPFLERTRGTISTGSAPPERHLACADEDHPDHEIADKLLGPVNGSEKNIAQNHVYEKQQAADDNGPSQECLLHLIGYLIQPDKKNS